MKAITAQGATDGLAAVAFTCEQDWRFDAALSLKTLEPVGTGLTVSPGVDFDFTFVERGRFRYLLRSHSQGIRVDVERLDEETRRQKESWKLELGLSPLAKNLYPRIQGQLGEANVALNNVLDLMPQPDEVRQRLIGAIGEALDGFDHKELLLAAVGLDPNKSIDQRIQEKLTELVSLEEELWAEDIHDAAARIATRVAGGLNAPEIADDLAERLKGGIEKGLEQLQKLLEKGIEEVVEGDGYQEFVSILDDLNEPVDATVTRLDQRVQELVQPVRRTLEKYQAWIAKIQAHLSTAAASRVSLDFFAETEQTTGNKFNLNFVIRPKAPRARELFQKLLVGDVAPLFAELSAEDVDSALCSVGGSSLAHYRRFKAHKGYAAVLLGFDLSEGSILDANTEVVIDAQGNLQVLSQLTYERYWSFLSEVRRYRFVDVYHFAGEARMGTLTLSMSISTEEDKIQ